MSKKDPKRRATVPQILDHSDLKYILANSTIFFSSIFSFTIVDKILKEIDNKDYKILKKCDKPFTLFKEVLERGDLRNKPETS